MRATFDIRLDELRRSFYVFEYPVVEPTLLPDLETTLSAVESEVYNLLKESLSSAQVRIDRVDAHWGSLDLVVHLASAAQSVPEWGGAGMRLVADRMLGVAIDQAVIAGAFRLFHWWRGRSVATARVAQRSLQPVEFLGDFLETARRVATHEGTNRQSLVAVDGEPEALKSGYRVRFRLQSASRLNGERLAVTVDWDGKGYKLRSASR